MRATAPVAIAQAAGKLVVPGVAPAFGRGQALGAALVALCFGIAGSQGPVLALWLGAGFAALGACTSAARLWVKAA